MRRNNTQNKYTTYSYRAKLPYLTRIVPLGQIRSWALYGKMCLGLCTVPLVQAKSSYKLLNYDVGNLLC